MRKHLELNTAARPPSGGGGEAGAAKPRRRYRPLPLREAMYQRVLELHARGLGYRRIIKEIEEEIGEKLSFGTVGEWCRGEHKPGGNVWYELKPSADLGWLLGVLKGDGNVTFQHGKKNYCTIQLCGRPEIVEIFAEAVLKVVDRDPLPIHPAGRGKVHVGFHSVRLYFLLSDFTTLAAFVESSEEVKRGFLQGFFDAEACITKDGRLFLYNTDLELLRRAQRWLRDFGIEATGPHLCKRKGRKFRDPETGKEYETKKDTYYIQGQGEEPESILRKGGLPPAEEAERARGGAWDCLKLPPPLFLPY